MLFLPSVALKFYTRSYTPRHMLQSTATAGNGSTLYKQPLFLDLAEQPQHILIFPILMVYYDVCLRLF